MLESPDLQFYSLGGPILTLEELLNNTRELKFEEYIAVTELPTNISDLARENQIDLLNSQVRLLINHEGNYYYFFEKGNTTSDCISFYPQDGSIEHNQI